MTANLSFPLRGKTLSEVTLVDQVKAVRSETRLRPQFMYDMNLLEREDIQTAQEARVEIEAMRLASSFEVHAFRTGLKLRPQGVWELYLMLRDQLTRKCREPATSK